MHHYTTYEGEDAYIGFTYPLANKTHTCDFAQCPHSRQIDRDTVYTKLTIIITGQGLYTERYHDHCYRWEYDIDDLWRDR